MTAKLSFRKWLKLETIKKNLVATESSDFPDRVFDYISVAFGSVKEDELWQNSVFSLMRAFEESQVDNNLPFLKYPSKEGKPAAWDYDGRSWAYWSNIIAKAYGWTLEYIGELDANEALALIQEILTDEQLEKEFVYGLSEIAYPYNSSTKKNIFKPMPRPNWMKETTPPLKKFKYARSLLPVGIVDDVSGMPSEFNPLRDYVVQKKTETKETNPPPSP